MAVTPFPFQNTSSSILQQMQFQFVANQVINTNEPIHKFVELYDTISLINIAMRFKAIKASQIKPMLYKTKDKAAAKEMKKWNGQWRDSYEYKQFKQLKSAAIDEIYLQDINVRDSSDEMLQLKKLLTRPNDFQSFSEFIEMLVTFYDLVGWSMIYVPVGKKGIIASLEAVPTHQIDIQGGVPSNPVKSYKWKGDYRYEIDPKFAYPFKSISTNYNMHGSHLYGTSVVKAIYTEVQTYIEACAREYTGFKTGDSAHLVFPKNPEAQAQAGSEPGVLQKLKDSIFKALRQKDRHQTAVVGQELGHINLASQLKDSNSTEVKKSIKEIVARGFMLPSRLVFNDNESSTYNNLVEDKKDALRIGVFPILNKIEETLAYDIIRPNFGLDFGFDYDCYPELNPDVIADMEKLAKVDYISDNEKRDWHEFDKLTDERAELPQKYWDTMVQPMNLDYGTTGPANQ